jgi:hypothetical protein
VSGPADLRLWNRETGELRPVPCRRLRCPVCLGTAAWRRGLAIRFVRPERFITFTLVGDDWQTIRGRMKQLRYFLVLEVGSVVWVWTVERNPRGTGFHVHAWQCGDFLPQREVARLARQVGMGERVDIRAWRAGGESYGLKEAYGLKSARAAGSFLAMNGGRLTHQSRGFFVGGVRAVEDQAVRAQLGPAAGTWEVVKVSELVRAGA